MNVNIPTINLYQVLGLEKGATVDEIRRSYKNLAMQYHPDKNPHGAEKFKQISEAYRILNDPEQKAIYDTAKKRPSNMRDLQAELNRHLGRDELKSWVSDLMKSEHEEEKQRQEFLRKKREEMQRRAEWDKDHPESRTRSFSFGSDWRSGGPSKYQEQFGSHVTRKKTASFNGSSSTSTSTTTPSPSPYSTNFSPTGSSSSSTSNHYTTSYSATSTSSSSTSSPLLEGNQPTTTATTNGTNSSSLGTGTTVVGSSTAAAGGVGVGVSGDTNNNNGNNSSSNLMNTAINRAFSVTPTNGTEDSLAKFLREVTPPRKDSTTTSLLQQQSTLLPPQREKSLVGQYNLSNTKSYNSNNTGANNVAAPYLPTYGNTGGYSGANNSNPGTRKNSNSEAETDYSFSRSVFATNPSPPHNHNTTATSRAQQHKTPPRAAPTFGWKHRLSGEPTSKDPILADALKGYTTQYCTTR